MVSERAAGRWDTKELIRREAAAGWEAGERVDASSHPTCYLLAAMVPSRGLLAVA